MEEVGKEKKGMYADGYLSGHIEGEDGCLYSVRVRVIFSVVKGEIAIRRAVAHRCYLSLGDKGVEVPLIPILPPTGREFTPEKKKTEAEIKYELGYETGYREGSKAGYEEGKEDWKP